MTPTPISHISLSSWAISGRNIGKSKKAALGTTFINIWYLSVINCYKALICSSLLNYWVLVCDLIFKSFFSTCWLYSGRPCQKNYIKTAVTYCVTAVWVESGARKLRHLAIIDRAQRRRTHGRERDAPYTHKERTITALSLGWRVGLEPTTLGTSNPCS